MVTQTAADHPSYSFLAHTAIVIHYLWTLLLFAGGALVLFLPEYAWYQIGIMSFTIVIWLPFGFKCPLTVWTHYFEKRGGIYDGDGRSFMVKQLSVVFGYDFNRTAVSGFVALFYVASYLTSIGALAGWWR